MERMTKSISCTPQNTLKFPHTNLLWTTVFNTMDKVSFMMDKVSYIVDASKLDIRPNPIINSILHNYVNTIFSISDQSNLYKWM